MTQSWRQQVEAARCEAKPYEALHAIAKSCRDQGVSQLALYHRFVGLQRAHEDDEDETFYDAIVEVLDDIWFGRDLYKDVLTNQDVESA